MVRRWHREPVRYAPPSPRVILPKKRDSADCYRRSSVCGSAWHRSSSGRSRPAEVREKARGVCVARWYDPGTGELTSVDPDLAETGQPYAYAGDDPVNMGDPSAFPLVLSRQSPFRRAATVIATTTLCSSLTG
jgi:hypothetical protein